MNTLDVKIKSLKTSGGFSVIEFDYKGDTLCATLIDINSSATEFRIGDNVKIAFKETEVSIGKNLEGLISLRNRMKCIIKKIETGEALSLITLEYKETLIISIITTGSAKRLLLKEGDKVEALVKANEVSMFI
jgi:molybdopterin-binding protein